MRQEYQVEVIETLSRLVTVEASSEESAIDKAYDMYYDENLVLDWSDHSGTEFKIYKEEE